MKSNIEMTKKGYGDKVKREAEYSKMEKREQKDMLNRLKE